jgi:hypothetical protein
VTVTFTGWDMTVEEMIRHGRSELVLHRWDLVGFDDASRRLLDDAELLAYGRKVLSHIGPLEAQADAALPAGASGPSALLTLWGRYPGWAPAPVYLVPAAGTGPVAQCGHDRREDTGRDGAN